MANVILSLFAVALIMGTVVVLGAASLSSANQVIPAWNGQAERNGRQSRSELTLVTADILGTSTYVDVSMQNTGQTAFRDFPRWDVMIEYYATTSNQGFNISWVPNTTTTPPANGKWAVTGLYMDTAATKSEVYDPNVVNPGEVLVLRLNVTPAIPTSTNNRITVGTPNGVTLAAPFSR